jgi:hypothetical protein
VNVGPCESNRDEEKPSQIPSVVSYSRKRNSPFEGDACWAVGTDADEAVEKDESVVWRVSARVKDEKMVVERFMLLLRFGRWPSACRGRVRRTISIGSDRRVMLVRGNAYPAGPLVEDTPSSQYLLRRPSPGSKAFPRFLFLCRSLPGDVSWLSHKKPASGVYTLRHIPTPTNKPQ